MSAMERAEDEVEPRAPTAARIAAETLALTAAFPGFGWLWHRDDPFFLRHGFAWLIFAPLLVGLRYGSAAGLVSASLLDAAMVIAFRARMAAVQSLPADVMLGLFVLAMLCGQFSDVFQRKLRKVRAGLGDAQARVQEIGSAYMLLERSHERLVQQVDRAVPNLAEAVRELRPQGDGSDAFRAMARPLLDLLATYYMVEVASIYGVENRTIGGEPWSALGSPRPVPADDPLVSLSLRAGAMVHVPLAREMAADEERSLLLAAIPLRDAAGVRALICIEMMPFIAFERRSLESLACLGARLAAPGGRSLELEREGRP